MVAWPLFAVGGVYAWAGVPLMSAAAVLAVIGRPRLGVSSETKTLDRLLLAAVAAVAIQLVPLPGAVRAALSPHTDGIRAALFLLPPAPEAWAPISVAPASTAYATGLVLSALIAFWTARQACAGGLTRRIIWYVSLSGLLASLIAIVLQVNGDRTLIYGRWQALDAGARPFGPFVNRNHFATWVVMALPLTIGLLAARLSTGRLPSGVMARTAALFEGLGTRTVWGAASVVLMTLALVISTSRSGLVAFGLSLASGAWSVRGRVGRRAGNLSLVALIAMVGIITAYADMQPLLSRVDETLAVGAGGRPRIWEETLRLVRDFWLTGTGLGTYQTAMLVYQQAPRTAFFNQAHNQYLHLLADGGVLLATPVVLAGAAFVRLFRVRLAQDTSSSVWLRIGGGVALFAVAVQGMWETGLRIPANGLLFAIAAAVAVHRPGDTINTGDPRVRRPSSGRKSASPADVRTARGSVSDAS